MLIYVICKKKHVQKHRYLLQFRENCTKLRIARYAHIYTPLDLCKAISDPVLNAFLNLLEIIFGTRGHTTIFEKIDYIPHFLHGAPTFCCHKKKIVRKFLFSITTFGKWTKKMKHFCKISSLPTHKQNKNYFRS